MIHNQDIIINSIKPDHADVTNNSSVTHPVSVVMVTDYYHIVGHFDKTLLVVTNYDIYTRCCVLFNINKYKLDLEHEDLRSNC